MELIRDNIMFIIGYLCFGNIFLKAILLSFAGVVIVCFMLAVASCDDKASVFIDGIIFIYSVILCWVLYGLILIVCGCALPLLWRLVTSRVVSAGKKCKLNDEFKN